MRWMILPLRRYAEFRGRSQRKEYWMFVLFQLLFYSILVALAIMSLDFTGADRRAMTAGGLGSGVILLLAVVGLIWLALLIPSLAVTIRRLHDSDRSGWWIMLYAGPYLVSLAVRSTMLQGAVNNVMLTISIVVSVANFVGGVALLVLMCLPGTSGPNRFGADPKNPEGGLAEVFG